jgi:PAT family beta-lactamase induction signal transducer AmpG
MVEAESSASPARLAINPWALVPSLYFMEGLPLFIVQTISATMFKSMGVDNASMALWTSLITWPWVVKMLWGPLVDHTETKRGWIKVTQVIMVGLIAIAALAVNTPIFFPLCLGIFFMLAFLSATHDIAADGFYLLAMPENEQANFVGVRSTAYRLSNVFANGVLVKIAGDMMKAKFSTSVSWMTALLAGAGVYAVGTTYHLRMLPVLETDPRREPLQLGRVLVRFGQVLLMLLSLLVGLQLLIVAFNLVTGKAAEPVFWFIAGSRSDQLAWEGPLGIAIVVGGAISMRNLFVGVGMTEIAREYFGQHRIAAILAFILFYRFGESMISKMVGPFLLDPPEKGGLGVSVSALAELNGVLGVIALVAGGILGGLTIGKFGIKRSIWPMVLALNIPNLLYVWAAFTKPGYLGAAAVIGVDQFGYGFGFSAYMVYLMFIAQGSQNQTSHYAISTGLMALGAMLAGAVSGKVQEYFANAYGPQGYAYFFVAVLVLAIPGILTLFFIPMDKEDIRTGPVDLD